MLELLRNYPAIAILWMTRSMILLILPLSFPLLCGEMFSDPPDCHGNPFPESYKRQFF